MSLVAEALPDGWRVARLAVHDRMTSAASQA